MFRFDLGDGADLRLFEPRQAADFLKLVQENREHFGRWLSWVSKINTLEDSRSFLQEGINQYAAQGLSGIGIWQDGELVGGVIFFPIVQSIQATNIAYFLAEKAGGRGLMTRAIRPMLRFVFEGLKFNRIGLEAEPVNKRSYRMAERLGFTFEGIRRDGWRSMGEFVDIGVFSLLAADWREMNRDSELS